MAVINYIEAFIEDTCQEERFRIFTDPDTESICIEYQEFDPIKNEWDYRNYIKIPNNLYKKFVDALETVETYNKL